jgi:hypothetical protein
MRRRRCAPELAVIVSRSVSTPRGCIRNEGRSKSEGRCSDGPILSGLKAASSVATPLWRCTLTDCVDTQRLGWGCYDLLGARYVEDEEDDKKRCNETN